MRDPITLLETIGADASLINASAAELGVWLECAGPAAPALRSALLQGDSRPLRELLVAPDIVCCLIDPAEEEEDDEEEEEGVEDGDDEDEDEDETGPVREPKPRGTPL